MSWKWKVGKIVLAVYPFLLSGALILAGVFFFNYLTEENWSDIRGVRAVTLGIKQTYVFNVTISYEVHGPNQGYGSRWENGSVVVEEPPFTNTITTWKRGWLSFMIGLNETDRDFVATINRTLIGPQGVIEPWAYISLSPGGGIGIAYPEITQGGTYRLSLENAGSSPVHVELNWNPNWYQWEKPYFYYGIAGLALALLYPALFVSQRLCKYLFEPTN